MRQYTVVYGNRTTEAQSAQRTADLGGVRERRGLSGSLDSVAVNFSGRSIRAVVTAPATEVAGIYGLSTNAMPPQGDCFMASTLAVPDFTYRTSLHNLISGVLRSSLADLPDSN